MTYRPARARPAGLMSETVVPGPWAADPGRRCANTDTELFFPPPGRLGNDAKRICQSGCPVLVECREWAILTHQIGIWGDTSDRERRDIRRDRNKTERTKAKC